MPIRTYDVDVTSTGADGSATGSASTKPMNGRLLAVHINYPADLAATTDVTIATDAPALTLLTVTNNATDGWYYPRVAVQDNTGTGVTYDGTNEIYEPYPVDDAINVTVAQSDAGTITITFKLEEAGR